MSGSKLFIHIQAYEAKASSYYNSKLFFTENLSPLKISHWCEDETRSLTRTSMNLHYDLWVQALLLSQISSTATKSSIFPAMTIRFHFSLTERRLISDTPIMKPILSDQRYQRFQNIEAGPPIQSTLTSPGYETPQQIPRQFQQKFLSAEGGWVLMTGLEKNPGRKRLDQNYSVSKHWNRLYSCAGPQWIFVSCLSSSISPCLYVRLLRSLSSSSPRIRAQRFAGRAA